MSAIVVSNIRIIALRDLHDVRKEVEAYPDDASLWQTVPGTTNPGGNLALHLAGNMRHYIAVVLCNSSYIRDRDAEFSVKGLTKEEVLGRVDESIAEVDNALSQLTDADLEKPYPGLGGLKLFTGQFLIHCLAHMGYHLGQMDYHRRIVSGTNKTISAQSIPGLESIPD